MMWALIVAGHVVGTYAGLGSCQSAEAVHNGTVGLFGGQVGHCVELPPPAVQQPQPGSPEWWQQQLLGCMAASGGNPAACGITRP
jgi:hypothetical protein